jgi:DNA-binding MarR family transcriptional regulator
MDSLEIARAASEAFRRIDPNIGAQTITVLLTVAQNDGRIIVSDLERLCGLTRESASRNVKLLSGAKLKDGRHGYGLVEKRSSDQDDRVKILSLTRSGQQVVQEILRAIQQDGGKHAR